MHLTKPSGIYKGEIIISSINCVRKTGQQMQKNETGPLSYTIHKN